MEPVYPDLVTAKVVGPTVIPVQHVRAATVAVAEVHKEFVCSVVGQSPELPALAIATDLVAGDTVGLAGFAGLMVVDCTAFVVSAVETDPVVVSAVQTAVAELCQVVHIVLAVAEIGSALAAVVVVVVVVVLVVRTGFARAAHTDLEVVETAEAAWVECLDILGHRKLGSTVGFVYLNFFAPP